MAPAEWQAVIVVVALLLLVGWVSNTAIRKYNSVDEALRLIAAFTGIIGVITGASTTYFFTRQPLIAARQQAEAYRAQAQTLQKQAADLQARNTTTESKYQGLKAATDKYVSSIGGSSKDPSVKWTSYSDAASMLQAYGILNVPEVTGQEIFKTSMQPVTLCSKGDSKSGCIQITQLPASKK